MALIPFPNVPLLPGVPSIPRNPLDAVTTVIALGSNVAARFLITMAPAAIWRIVYADGLKDAIVPDNFISVDYSNRQSISNFPIEKGSFSTYNKVATPYQVRVLISKGGSDSVRQKFAIACDGLATSQDIFNIATPDYVYFRAACVGVEFSKTNRSGATLLIAALTFEEVRLIPSARFNEPKPVKPEETKSVNAPSPVADGQVRTYVPGSSNGTYTETTVQ